MIILSQTEFVNSQWFWPYFILRKAKQSFNCLHITCNCTPFPVRLSSDSFDRNTTDTQVTEPCNISHVNKTSDFSSSLKLLATTRWTFLKEDVKRADMIFAIIFDMSWKGVCVRRKGVCVCVQKCGEKSLPSGHQQMGLRCTGARLSGLKSLKLYIVNIITRLLRGLLFFFS